MTHLWRAQRACTAFLACSERSSGVRAIRAFVALWAFLALLAAFLGLVNRPSATAAGFFFVMSLGSIGRKEGLDKRATVR